MKTAIYPGTFDPITNGHIDVLKKAVKIFDKVILAVAETTGKETIFSTAERLELSREAVQDIPQIKVVSFSGLVVDYAIEINADAMIRGLRALSDFEYELSLALMNGKLNKKIDTVFFVPDLKYLYVSSSLIRQVLYLGGNVEDMLPKCVEQALLKKYKK